MAGVEAYLQGVSVSRARALSQVKMPVESGQATDAAAQVIWDAATVVVGVGEQIIGHTDTCMREEAAKTYQHRAPISLRGIAGYRYTPTLCGAMATCIDVLCTDTGMSFSVWKADCSDVTPQAVISNIGCRVNVC